MITAGGITFPDLTTAQLVQSALHTESLDWYRLADRAFSEDTGEACLANARTSRVLADKIRSDLKEFEAASAA